MARRLLRENGVLEQVVMLLAQHEDDNKNRFGENFEYNSLNLKVLREKAICLLNLIDLQERIAEEDGWVCHERYYLQRAVNIVKNIPKPLWINMEEWLDGSPLSDVKVKGISVGDIYGMYDWKNLDFLDVIDFFIEWKRLGFKGDGYDVFLCCAY